MRPNLVVAARAQSNSSVSIVANKNLVTMSSKMHIYQLRLKAINYYLIKSRNSNFLNKQFIWRTYYTCVKSKNMFESFTNFRFKIVIISYVTLTLNAFNSAVFCNEEKNVTISVIQGKTVSIAGERSKAQSAFQFSVQMKWFQNSTRSKFCKSKKKCWLRKNADWSFLFHFEITFENQKLFSICFLILLMFLISVGVIFLSRKLCFDWTRESVSGEFYNGNVKATKVFVNYMQFRFAMDFSCFPHTFFLLLPFIVCVWVSWLERMAIILSFPLTGPLSENVREFIHESSDKNPIQLPSLQWFNHIALNKVCSCRLCRFLSRRSLNAPLLAEEIYIVQKLFSVFYSTKLLKQ